MRAIAYALTGVFTLTAAGAAFADDMPGMAMSGAPAAKHGQGKGVIKAIDAKAGTLTLQHGPIPAVSWPAMTMTFKASPPCCSRDSRSARPSASTRPSWAWRRR